MPADEKYLAQQEAINRRKKEEEKRKIAQGWTWERESGMNPWLVPPRTLAPAAIKPVAPPKTDVSTSQGPVNPTLTMPNFKDWVAGGTYQVNIDTGVHDQTGATNTPLDPGDKNLPEYYANYKNAVKQAIESGNLAHAKNIVRSHGQAWTDPPTDTTIVDPTVDPPPQGPPIVPNVDPSQTINAAADYTAVLGNTEDLSFVQDRVTDLINTNSPLFKAASTKALQMMARRGIVNSTMAQEAVMQAILGVAIPIAQEDARTWNALQAANQGYSNAMKASANQAYQAEMMQRLNASVESALTMMTQSAANWRALLNARLNIVTQEDTSAEQINMMLGNVTPGNFWNQYNPWLTTSSDNI